MEPLTSIVRLRKLELSRLLGVRCTSQEEVGLIVILARRFII